MIGGIMKLLGTKTKSELYLYVNIKENEDIAFRFVRMG